RRDTALAAVEPGVEKEEDREQDRGDEQHRREQMNGRPEEADAFEEAEEQRRVAERRERSADVGDKENEKDDDVGVKAAVVVGADDRADQQHGRARGSGEAGGERAD